jgi:hypothetical protein
MAVPRFAALEAVFLAAKPLFCSDVAQCNVRRDASSRALGETAAILVCAVPCDVRALPSVPLARTLPSAPLFVFWLCTDVFRSADCSGDGWRPLKRSHHAAAVKDGASPHELPGVPRLRG